MRAPQDASAARPVDAHVAGRPVVVHVVVNPDSEVGFWVAGSLAIYQPTFGQT